jgi:N-acetylglutamate synthase-like GNAT family acetyltransferase
MTIRAATSEDVGQLHALIESAYRGDSAKRGWTHEADLLGGQRTDPELLLAMLDDPKQSLWVADHGGMLIGCVCVTDQGHGVGYLGLLSVRPDGQAEGLGKRLIAAAEAHARTTLEAKTMKMTVIKARRELIAYYERRGYVNTGREEPFPMDDPRFGVPKTDDLVFVVLEKAL